MSKARGCFITGTDTGVGKTFFTSLWVAALREHGIDAVGFKPFCCGDRDDAERLHAAASGAATLDEINPVWLKTPASPNVAARMDGATIHLPSVFEAYRNLAERHEMVLVEGVGGWRVPVTASYDSRDFAVDLGLPAVVVAMNKLGVINHTVLTVDSIRAAGLTCRGIILNHSGKVDPIALHNRGEIERMTGLPTLCEIQPGQSSLAELPQL